MNTARIAFAIGLVVAHRAVADEVHGFVVGRGEQVSGVVTDDDGHPIAGATVLVASARGEQFVRSDRDGKYSALLATGADESLVFAYGDVRIGGTTVLSASDAIELRATLPPAVTPRLVHNVAIVPPYSDEAIGDGQWEKVWLLLDVDDTGTVARAKLLDAPGLGLDDVALATAFSLRFHAARDRTGRAIRAEVVWTFDWPPHWWMTENANGYMTRVPREAWVLPCRSSGIQTPHARVRNCSAPTLANAFVAPWVERPRR